MDVARQTQNIGRLYKLAYLLWGGQPIGVFRKKPKTTSPLNLYFCPWMFYQPADFRNRPTDGMASLKHFEQLKTSFFPSQSWVTLIPCVTYSSSKFQESKILRAQLTKRTFTVIPQEILENFFVVTHICELWFHLKFNIIPYQSFLLIFFVQWSRLQHMQERIV